MGGIVRNEVIVKFDLRKTHPGGDDLGKDWAKRRDLHTIVTQRGNQLSTVETTVEHTPMVPTTSAVVVLICLLFTFITYEFCPSTSAGGHTSGGRGYANDFSPTMMTGMSSGRSIIGTSLRSPIPTDMPAFLNAIKNGFEAKEFLSQLGSTTYIDSHEDPTLGWPILTSIPASPRVVAICVANRRGSILLTAVTITDETLSFRVCRASYCAFESILGASCASSSILARSALPARSFASPAPLIAADSLSSERFRSSVCILASFLPKRTSPTIPNATAAPAVADPHCSRNESYSGWMPAMINSAVTPATTNPAHHHSHSSHADDAFSSWSSVAFIVPFRKRHAGKEFLGFWFGIATGAIIFSVLFIVSLFVK
jgi:hypothetical protein